MSVAPPHDRCDVAIVGAGIVGLACAFEAAERGLSVVVCERDDRAVGATVRNFGHGFASGQSGEAFEAALVARERWLMLADRAGFWAAPTGTVLAARHEDELEVCRELATDERRRARVVSAQELAALAPVAADGLVGGLVSELDVRVDMRTAPAALAAWLEDEHDVDVRFRTPVQSVDGTTLHTPRGTIEADAVVVAPGHDLDALYPETFAAHGVSRVGLQMLLTEAPRDITLHPALVTGLSLLRYGAFEACPTLPAVRARLERERPELIAAGIHLIVTQLPTGELIVGDTHHYDRTPSPFRDERLDDLLLDEASQLLGSTRPRVLERWLGVYAHAPGRDFLVAAPAPHVRIVAVTSGIGMTTALGLAPRVLDELRAGIDTTYEEAHR